MLRGLYAAASAMAAQLARQELYAHNLANANTIGYRRCRAAVSQFAADLQAARETLSAAAGGVAAASAALDLRQGPLQATNRPLDLAINGEAFFVVQTPQGIAYTRDGRFTIDAQRRLVTLQGYPVLGVQGPITLPPGDFTVTESGELRSGGQVVAQLRLATPINPQPLGGGLYRAAQARAPRASIVCQGMLEQANVNGIEEMARMLSGYRLYEANATALRVQDETISSLQRIVS